MTPTRNLPYHEHRKISVGERQNNLVISKDHDRIQNSLRNNSSIQIDYIPFFFFKLNQFEIFVSSLIHERSLKTVLF